MTQNKTYASPEISWFSALCDDDYEYLGSHDPFLKSSWKHCSTIMKHAEEGGFDNILLPSGYQLGIDGVAYAAGMAMLTRNIKMLLAVRCGEMWPPQLARQLATLNQMMEGRLTINIISSDLPGAPIDSAPRYQRSIEVMRVLRDLMDGKDINHQGEFYQLELEAPSICKQSAKDFGGCPPFYFGGMSPAAREAAADMADVFLMWPDREQNVRDLVGDMKKRAEAKKRDLKFGYRAHVIVRETEAEALDYTRRLMKKFDAQEAEAIRARSLDSKTAGVQAQDAARAAADKDGFVEDQLWTGIGRARSGCGAAIVGDPDQVLAKIRFYQDLGMESFIFSGYPHAAECDMFARYVLPELEHGPLF